VRRYERGHRDATSSAGRCIGGTGRRARAARRVAARRGRARRCRSEPADNGMSQLDADSQRAVFVGHDRARGRRVSTSTETSYGCETLAVRARATPSPRRWYVRATAHPGPSRCL
jgi:hypothetical protein